MVDFYMALSGSGAAADERPQLRVDATAIEAAAAQAGVRPGDFWAFAPGAEYGPAKRWPAARYAELASSLRTASGLPVVLLGSAAEAPLCEAISAAAGDACMVLAASFRWSKRWR
jgi:heptosyltransferase-2